VKVCSAPGEEKVTLVSVEAPALVAETRASPLVAPTARMATDAARRDRSARRDRVVVSAPIMTGSSRVACRVSRVQT